MKNHIIQLFTSFFKIGAFTFGGGLAMIPLIQKEACEKHRWVDEDEISDIVSISESTPGPIAVNAATFIGFQVSGFAGALAATFGVVLPSFVIISVIAYLLSMNYDLSVINYAFFGIRAGVIAILFQALYKMYKKSPKGIFAYILMAGAFVVVAILKVNVFLTIIGCAILGLIYSALVSRRGKHDLS